MTQVNAQVLGYNSTNHATASSSKQTLVNAVNSTQAVTIGTRPGASAGGLVGGHAYTVTGYNATTDRFTLHNPWGVQHPTPLTWAQLQSDTSMFIVTNTAGSTTVNGGTVRSSATEMMIGNWTTVVPSNQLVNIAETDELQLPPMDAAGNQETSREIFAEAVGQPVSNVDFDRLTSIEINGDEAANVDFGFTLEFISSSFAGHDGWLIA